MNKFTKHDFSEGVGGSVLKSSIQLLNEIKNRSNKKNDTVSMVQQAKFRDEVDFAGSNKVIQEVYRRYISK